MWTWKSAIDRLDLDLRGPEVTSSFFGEATLFSDVLLKCPFALRFLRLLGVSGLMAFSAFAFLIVQ
jgi:hypothetical protein